MRKIFVVVLGALLVLVAAPAQAGGESPDHAPPRIDLPDGIFPEGIAIGRGSTFYVGSLTDGSIYRGDLRTGEGEVLTAPTGAFSTVGLSVDRHQRVWAAGGPTGTGRVYDGITGELLATYELTGPLESFINDVIVTPHGAWFTDSGTQLDPDPDQFRFAGAPRLFKVPLGRHGELPDPSAVEELATDIPDVGFPNLNGVETAPNRHDLVVAHTGLGSLYTVDPRTGSGQEIDIDTDFIGADGLVRRGRTMYVVENGAAQIAEVRLDPSVTKGVVRRVLPVTGSETPTTAALYRDTLYVVDARFVSMTGPYQLFSVPLR